MRSLVRCDVVLCLALLGSMPVRGQTTLNLSQDLVALGIAGTNMVPNQPSQDAGPLLVQGVAYAERQGIPLVIADPGAYYFLSLQNPNWHVQLEGLHSLTIDLQHSDLIFTQTYAAALYLGFNTGVTFQNFTIDYQPLPFTQVRVVSVNPATAQIQYAVQPGWPDPSTFNTAPAGTIVQVHIFRNGQPAYGTGRMAAQSPMSGNLITLIPYDTIPTAQSMVMIRPGDVAVVAMRTNLSTVITDRCISCTLRNVTVYSGTNAAVQTNFSSSSTIERVYMIPKPGTDRLVSAFGINSIHPGPNSSIRLSRAIRSMDDGFGLFGHVTGLVQSQPSSKTLTVAGIANTTLNWIVSVPDGSPVALERPLDGALLASATVVSQVAGSTSVQPYLVTYTFDRDLPSGLIGSYLYSTDANLRGSNSVVERNLAQSNAAGGNGLDVGGWASGSAFRGNYLRRNSWTAIMANQHLEDNCCDDKSEPLANVTFSNNVMDGANLSPSRNYWFYALGAMQVSTLRSNPGNADTLMTGSPHQNITIANNFVADAGRSAIWFGNTAGGSVTGNYLLSAGKRPDLPDVDQGHLPDATTPLVIDMTSSGIATSNNTIDTTSGVTFVTDTAYRELAAYAPGSTMRLNAYSLGALASPTATLTDADGVKWPIPIQSTSAHALDVQLPPGTALGGAYVTLTSGGTQYFGTLFLDSQDNIPAVNGCVYEVSPFSLTVPGTATTLPVPLPVLVVTQPGCGYQVTASDAFVTPGPGGTGTAVITVGFAANSGDTARTTTIEIAGQPFTISQAARPVASDLSLDTPTGGAVATPVLIAGWALNRGAVSGTGVDAIHLYLTPAGGPTTFLGVATYGAARADLAALYGSQFTNSGFTFSVNGLAPGTYTLSVFAHDAMTNTFDASRNVTFTVVRPVPDPHIAVDTPTRNATVTSAFEVGGWLLDAGATIGTGVDDVKIYVQLPGGPVPGVFIGHGRLGLPRADVGALYGARFNSAGFHFTITGLAPSLGNTLWVIGHDTLTNADTISMSVPFNVDAKALMSIDLPSAEAAIASNTFFVSGWAIDRGIEDSSAPGTGVDTIVLYAFHNPGSGEPAIFLGYADYGHIPRADVGRVLWQWPLYAERLRLHGRPRRGRAGDRRVQHRPHRAQHRYGDL